VKGCKGFCTLCATMFFCAEIKKTLGIHHHSNHLSACQHCLSESQTKGPNDLMMMDTPAPRRASRSTKQCETLFQLSYKAGSKPAGLSHSAAQTPPERLFAPRPA
jgi:hypothetical protein